MSTLNNSIIIYDTISKPTKSTRKNTCSKIKKKQKTIKRTYYESPLKHIQLSNKIWEQMETQNKLILNTKQASNAKKNSLSFEDNFLQNSVIILSDNESESYNEEDKKKCGQEGKTGKRPLEVSIDDKQSSQYLHNSNKTLNDTKTIVETPQRKRRKKNNVLLENNSSCLLISDTEESEIATINLDDENIAPMSDSVNQESDDIIVVWSSTKASPSEGQSNEQTRDQEKYNRLFMIDCSPNPKNLSCLEFNEEIMCQHLEKSSIENTEENESTCDLECLPFSKAGLQFPKAVNISKIISIKARRIPNKLINREQKTSKSSVFASAVCAASTTSGSTIATTSAVVTTSANMATEFDMPATSSVASTFTVSTIPLTNSLQTATETCKLHEPSNSGLSGLELCRPALRRVESSTLQSSNRLREIVIDGNNVAMEYKKNKMFSEEGLLLVVNYFKQRGHSVKVFVPHYRRSTNYPLLEKLYADGTVIFTPSRRIGGRWITPYDDRFILEYATLCGGIVVSSDQYRDLYLEKPEWRDTIENRLLTPTFVGNYVMFPEDPLGRRGPKLEEFLRY